MVQYTLRIWQYKAPELEATMESKREQAEKILNEIPKTPEGIRSDRQPDLFLKWTGMSHKELMDSWRANMKGPTLLTACGGFAAKFGLRIGIKDIKSYFKLKQSLADIGKSHAWVPASSGAKPEVGDILRHSPRYHVDVAAGWDGVGEKAKLKRVAAGQSVHKRPTTSVENEFDALKWVTGANAYNPANLEGWLDLDKYFDVAPSVGPIGPTFGWLKGWWKVWDGNTYWYHFGPNGTVQYTMTEPTNLSSPPIKPTNVGNYSYTLPSTLVVTWNKVSSAPVACRETFHAVSGCQQMNGKSNLYGPLFATRAGGGGVG
jgi:hypothetical protein